MTKEEFEKELKPIDISKYKITETGQVLRMTKEELEKEAEEYIKEHSYFDEEFGLISLDVTSKTAFKDGAEFGYNKAMNEQGYRIESAYREGVAFGKDKANEWHYPSKGELPKCDEKTQLIFYVTCYYGDITRKRTVLGYYQKSFMNDDVKLFVEKSKGYEDEHLPKDVIAWKEIVLPKESE